MHPQLRAQHPDKCPDDPEATARFQALSIIHATLSDEDKRRSYDETGEVESEEAELKQSEQEWYDYWRVLFPTVTVEKIKKFQKEYQGSEEEKGDVLKAYEEGQGKMSLVIDNVMLATDDDEGRFREIIEGAIAAKEVKRLKGFKEEVQKDAKRKKRAEKVRAFVYLICLALLAVGCARQAREEGWVVGWVGGWPVMSCLIDFSFCRLASVQ